MEGKKLMLKATGKDDGILVEVKGNSIMVPHVVLALIKGFVQGE